MTSIHTFVVFRVVSQQKLSVDFAVDQERDLSNDDYLIVKSSLNKFHSANREPLYPGHGVRHQFLLQTLVDGRRIWTHNKRYDFLHHPKIVIIHL